MINHELNPNDPVEIFNWINNTILNNPTKLSTDSKVNIKPSKETDEFFTETNWLEWDWIILIVTLEIKFNVFIPDSYVANTNITFSEFATMLSQLPIIEDPAHVYDRIKMIGDVIYVNKTEFAKSAKLKS